MADSNSVEHHDHDDHHDDHIHPFARKFLFLGDQKIIDGFIWLPIIGLAVTIPLALYYPFDSKHMAPWDFFASWAIIGFLAYSAVVFSARPMFAFLARKENYYGEEVEPEIVVEPVVEVHHHD